MFDREKLKFINSKYLKALSKEALAQKVKPYLEDAHIEILSEDWLLELVEVFQERMHYVSEIVTLYKNFLELPFDMNEEMLQFLRDNHSLKLLETFLDQIETKPFNPENIQVSIKETGTLLGIKGKPLFMSIRIATTAEMHGPSLPHVISLLTKEKVTQRILQIIKILRGEL